MPIQEITITADGYKLDLGPHSLTAQDASVDKSGVKAALSLYNGEVLVIRDVMNLTKDSARAQFCQKAGEHDKDLPRPLSKALLALEEAIRRSYRQKGPNGHKHNTAESVRATTASPPSLADLLTMVRGFIKRYMIMSAYQLDACTLWVVHTYVVDAADATPYIAPRSPEPESGKTRLLEVCEVLVPNP